MPQDRKLSECPCTCNCTCPDNPTPPGPEPEPDNSVEKYDIRDNYPHCIGEVRNQESCGSCWAHSAINVFSTTYCIKKQLDTFMQFSIQDLVSCDKHNNGCNGGQLDTPFRYYMTDTGVTTDSCVPYTSGKGSVPSCPTSCVSSDETMTRNKCLAGSTVDLANDIKGIKTWLQTEGPLDVGFEVFQDFMYYAGGIYKHTKGELVGGHAVTLIGFGKEDDVDYWILKNSWGPNWAENGYFRMKMGDCKIDSWGVTSCLPE